MFGEQLYNLVNKGEADPRLALMAAMGLGGSTPDTPMAGGGTSAGAGTAPGTAAPAAPPQPAAYQSPPEIMQLYQQMLERQRRVEGINNSIGLIFSSFAQPESKAGILSAARGAGGGTQVAGGSDFLTQMLEFQQKNATIQQRAATRQSVPDIGKRYGLDPATALYLYDTDELDDVIKEAEKPNKQLQQMADGTYAIVDLGNGSVSDPIGPKKPRDIEIIEDDMGNRFAVDKSTGQRIGEENISEGMGATNNSKLWREDEADRKARGLPSRSLSEFLASEDFKGSLGGTKVDIQMPGDESAGLVGELEKDFSTAITEEHATARNARRVIDDVATARSKLEQGIIAGSSLSPLELEGRKIWADIMGIPDEETSTTEAFKASLKETVLSKIKALGSGTAISDADRKFIEQAVAGDITLTEGAMRQIFDILEGGARKVVEGYNKDIDELINSFDIEEDKKRVKRLLRKIDLPEPEAADGDDVPIEDLVEQYLKE